MLRLRKNKKVKHLVPLPPPYGGVTEHVKRLVFRVCNNYLHSAYRSGREINQEGLELYFPLTKRNLVLTLIRLKRTTSGYDIIHSHNFFNDALLLYPFFRKRKIVFTVHNDRSLQIFNELYLVEKMILRIIFRLTSLNMIFVSEQAQSSFEEVFGKSGGKIIPAFIANTSEKELIPDFIEEFINSHRKVILYYANNNQKDDIYSYALSKDLFSSKFPDDIGIILSVTEYEGILPEFPENVLLVTGDLPEFNSILGCCHMLFRPTRADGDSLSVRDALADGLIVYASDVTRRPYGTYIFSIETPLNEIRKEMIELLRDEERTVISSKDYYDELIKYYDDFL